jgi:hypothetical protein
MFSLVNAKVFTLGIFSIAGGVGITGSGEITGSAVQAYSNRQSSPGNNRCIRRFMESTPLEKLVVFYKT